jgi:hypothetical protein
MCQSLGPSCDLQVGCIHVRVGQSLPCSTARIGLGGWQDRTVWLESRGHGLVTGETDRLAGCRKVDGGRTIFSEAGLASATSCLLFSRCASYWPLTMFGQAEDCWPPRALLPSLGAGHVGQEAHRHACALVGLSARVIFALGDFVDHACLLDVHVFFFVRCA